ncbi:MAG: LCP family protein [Actinobacteria bacterium]|nr:LCP family protein [Actinomycetota bacterium]
MSTGGADGPDEPSAPWERPRLWADEPDSDTGMSAQELIARLQDASAVAEPHRRRRAPEETAATASDPDATTVIPASELIAALSNDSGSQPSSDPSGDLGSEPAPDVSAGDMAPPENSVIPGNEAPSDTGDTADVVPVAAPPPIDRTDRGWAITGRALVAALAVLLLVVSGTAYVIKARADATLRGNQISALDPNDSNIAPTTAPSTGPGAPGAAVTTAQAAKTYAAENILILGSDTRAKAADAKLGGANTDPGGSDVIMVAHLSADRSHVTVVSIPRDMYVPAPTCKAWDYKTGQVLDQDYTSPYTTWRINATYAAGGPACTVKAVQELTGLRIDRMMVIDFSGFAAIVNALGGIEVDACRPIVDAQLGTVLPVAGEQHINGVQALNLVRARKVQGDNTSDLARIKRQQKVLSTILRQMTSAGVLLNPVKLDSVLQAVVKNVQTDNVTLDDLIEIAQSLGHLDPSHVTFFTLPTVPDANGVALDPAPNAELIWQALQRDQLLPGEVTGGLAPSSTTGPATASTTGSTTGPTTGPTITSPSASPTPVTQLVTQLVTSTPVVPQMLSVAPRDVNLQVVNVAGRGGVANQAMNALVPLGFRLTGPDLLLLSGQNQRGITVEYSAGNRAAAVTVAAAVPGATLVEKGGLGSKVRLMLGSSFGGTVRAVSVGAPVPAALSTTAKPVVSTVVSTIVTTPAASSEPAPSTTSATSVTSSLMTTPTTTTGPTFASSDLTSVNAGDAGCI